MTRTGIFEVYRDGDKQWRWRLRSSNGKVLASGEAYKNLKDCLKTVDRVKDSSKCAVEVESTVFKLTVRR